MGEVHRLIEELRREYEGEPWHGSSTQSILHGVTAAQAAARILPEAHTIWEIVLHLTGWTQEVCKRLQGGKPQLPSEGDWPVVGSTGEAAWRGAQAALTAAHAELLTTLQEFPESGLQGIVEGTREVAAGPGVSFYVTLHGLVQHDAYHSGQIALLKKATSSLTT